MGGMGGLQWLGDGGASGRPTHPAVGHEPEARPTILKQQPEEAVGECGAVGHVDVSAVGDEWAEVSAPTVARQGGGKLKRVAGKRIGPGNNDVGAGTNNVHLRRGTGQHDDIERAEVGVARRVTRGHSHGVGTQRKDRTGRGIGGGEREGEVVADENGVVYDGRTGAIRDDGKVGRAIHGGRNRIHGPGGRGGGRIGVAGAIHRAHAEGVGGAGQAGEIHGAGGGGEG